MQIMQQVDDLTRIKQTLMDALETKQTRKYISKKKLLKYFLKSRRLNQQQQINTQPQKVTKRKKIEVIQSYVTRNKITKEKNIVEEDQQRLIECPICMDYLVNPVQTQCGHTFCEICLTEALLKQNICAMCKKVIPNFNFVIDELLDGLVKQYVESNTEDSKEKYQVRRKKYLLWNKKRRPQQFIEDMKVDIRDLDNIWCEAVIKKIDRTQKNQEFLFIHYTGWNSIYDEMLPSTSNRIASSGFFTKRSDIPQYRLNNQNNQNSEDFTGAMQGVVLLGGEGQANLEGNIEDDELMEIDEAEFQQEIQLANNNQQQNNGQGNSDTNHDTAVAKIFESIFKVKLTDISQLEKK